MAFDLSAAFDTLGHSTLLSKLKSAGILGTPLKWFESYLSNRSQSVLWNGNISSSRQINRGVPQGSILGPILFLAMIHDMPRYLTKDTYIIGIHLQKQKGNIEIGHMYLCQAKQKGIFILRCTKVHLPYRFLWIWPQRIRAE